MVKPVGGRGNKAPYESTHVRVPVPIKSQVQALIDEFREHQTLEPRKPLTSLDDDGDEEEDDRSDPSDLETIKSQAEMIQRYVLEIQSLKREVDKLNSLTSLEEAKELARSILKAKKSSSQSIAKLLTGIYQVDVSIDDLKVK
jgi:predicted RNase H-like nuclease (RuvC/YqgF family)